MALLLLAGLSSVVRADDLSGLAGGSRILASRTAGNWVLLSVSDVESGGQVLACKLDGRWHKVTSGGGVMGAGEFYQHGVPQELWSALLGHPLSAEEMAQVKQMQSEDAPPDDAGRLLKAADLQHASAWSLLIWRNSIYARHGYVFHDPLLAQYFSSRPWYHPDPGFNPKSLSAVERSNVEFIRSYQKQHGLDF
ncbi:MAG: YARHG domain-containing protein [Vulcanimicrobiota bacterium]